MKKLLLILFLIVSHNLYSQTLIQTWTDRCTGEVKTFSIAMTGYTTVVFYNKVKQFTAADVQSGALRVWMEETYFWWSQLSPCSTNQAANQSAQDTANQAASNASNAASNAASSASSSASSSTASTNTGTNGTSNGTGSTSTGSSSSSSSSTDSNSSSSGSSENSGSGDNSNSSEDSSSSGESSGDSSEGGDGESGSSEGESSSDKKEDQKEEEVKEEKSEEKKEEKKEEEKEEEKKEEKEEKEEEEKKKVKNPISLASNVATMSGLDGSLNQVLSFGFSQSSLTGTTTYSANLMVWSNLNQFSLSLGKSEVIFNQDREIKNYLYNPFTEKKDLYINSDYTSGSINHVQSTSAGFMYIFGTKVVSYGTSGVFLGQKDNFWKGFAGGYAFSSTTIIIKKDVILMPSFVLFATKPFPTKRITISPMVALAFNPISYAFNIKKPTQGDFTFTPYFTYIVGSNFDFSLTQRFRANIGGNVVGNTQPGIPLTYSITIGSKFQF